MFSRMKYFFLNQCYRYAKIIPRKNTLPYLLLIKALGSILRFIRGWRYPSRTTKFITSTFVYIGNPKVANTSIRETLKSVVNENNYLIKSCSIKEVKKLQKTHKVFTFVRNPYDRVWSFYNEKFICGTIFSDIVFIGGWSGLRPDMTFLAFCQWLNTPSGADYCADPHWVSQYKILDDCEGHSVCDIIGRFELLSDDWTRIQDEINFPKAILYRVNVSSQPQFNESNYCDESKALIAKRYKEDFIRFQYDI